MLHDILRQTVEHSVGFKIVTARNFDELSNAVWERTKERLSPTTLKRFWGYLKNEQVETRTHTLDVLAKFVGYRNFDAFCNHRKDFECVQSRIIGSDSIDVKNLLRGELLHITWLPDRSVIVKYLGNSRFEVTESINSKLSVGDTFSCNLFIQNEPLYLSNLIHEGSTPLTYVAGENNGVNIRVLIGS